MHALDDYMLRWHRAGRFDGVAAVVRRGEVLLSAGYGYSSYEHRVPHTPHTRFQIGSMTKSFLAQAVLQLADQGRLHLDDRVARWIPEFRWAEQVNIHQLLAHTSGIPDHTSFREYSTRERLTPEIITARINQRDLLFAPGTDLVYSNSNYVLLAKAVEAVTGMPVGEYLRARVLEPAGLRDTGVALPGAIIDHLAHGYSYSGEGLVQADPYDLSGAYGSGNMYATAGDLIKWADHLAAGDIRMRTPNGRIPHLNASWGYGLYARENCLFLAGFLCGYNCQVTRLLDAETTVVLLSNNDTTPLHRIEAGLLEILQGRTGSTAPVTPTPVPWPGPATGITGTYRCPYTGGVFTITSEDGWVFTDRLFTQTCRQEPYALIPVAYSADEVTFACAVCDGTFRFWPKEGRALYTWDTFQMPYTKDD